MGQRHNRRRTRPRSRNRSINTIASIDSSLHPANPCDTAIPFAPRVLDSSKPSLACDLRDSIPISLAHTWHNGYMTWQARNCKLRPQATTMEAEQYRLFGGEPGDDVNLCYRMLEYFGGLDYIDSSQFSRLPG